MNEQTKLQFRKDGSFRILHLTDIQEGLHPRKDTMHLLNGLLAETMPDLVILTGDQLKGYSPLFRLAGEKGLQLPVSLFFVKKGNTILLKDLKPNVAVSAVTTEM